MMKVSSEQTAIPALVQTGVQGENDPTGFQANLAIAQQNQDKTAASSSTSKEKSEKLAGKTAQTAQEELAEYLRKTPAQHMRDAILKELGLTEEDLAALPPEKRAAIEETIADRIKEKLEASTHNAPNPATLSLLSMLAFAKGDKANKETAGIALLSG